MGGSVTEVHRDPDVSSEQVHCWYDFNQESLRRVWDLLPVELDLSFPYLSFSLDRKSVV